MSNDTTKAALADKLAWMDTATPLRAREFAANEWAEIATNATTVLKNVRDGIETFDGAIKYFEDGYAYGREVSAKASAALLRANAAAVPDVLFDGYAVLQALDAKAKARTSAENVSDVLDAVVKLIRAAAPSAPLVAEAGEFTRGYSDGWNACVLHYVNRPAALSAAHNAMFGEAPQQPVQGGGDACREALAALKQEGWLDYIYAVAGPGAEAREKAHALLLAAHKALALPPAQPAPQAQGDDVRTLSKWLNEESTAPIDRQALARVLSAAPGLGLPLAQEPKYTTDGLHLINRHSGETIPHDEPVFLFRARDALAVRALRDYLVNIKASARAPDHMHADAVAQRVVDFERFASSHPERMKWPDTAATPPSPVAQPEALPVQGDESIIKLRRAAEDAIRAANPRFGPFIDAVANPLAIIALCDRASLPTSGVPADLDFVLAEHSKTCEALKSATVKIVSLRNEIEALRSAPQPAAARVGLSEDEIAQVWAFDWTGDRVAFIRSVERRLGITAAHGIASPVADGGAA